MNRDRPASNLRRFERSFLRLETSMLRCRFHVIHGRTCTRESWIQYAGQPIESILCYVGYSDARGEMRLMCREAMDSLRTSTRSSDRTARAR